jgi:hypothetical protein
MTPVSCADMDRYLVAGSEVAAPASEMARLAALDANADRHEANVYRPQ